MNIPTPKCKKCNELVDSYTILPRDNGWRCNRCKTKHTMEEY